MHKEKESSSDVGGHVGIARNKRGPSGKKSRSAKKSPNRRPSMMEKKLMTLIEQTQRQSIEQNNQVMLLMSKLLDQVNAASLNQKTWLDMFRPPTSPSKSTSPEEREAMRDNDSLWTEIDAQELQQKMAKELGLDRGEDGNDLF